jgi:hypothetical protein
MSGSNASNENGVYGVQCVPDSNNIPGARSNAVSWMDNSGNMWMFGGSGYGYSSDSYGNAIHVNFECH